MLIEVSDPIPFQWLAQDRELCSAAKFIDVDFEELMISKREIIRNTPRMKDLLSVNAEVPQENGIVFDSEEYVGIGCDLRNPRRLERLLKSVVDIDDCLILCLAEVSITYMAPEDSDALIAWTSTLSPGIPVNSPDLLSSSTDKRRCHILFIRTAVSRSSRQSVYYYHDEPFFQAGHSTSFCLQVSWMSHPDSTFPECRFSHGRDTKLMGVVGRS